MSKRSEMRRESWAERLVSGRWPGGAAPREELAARAVSALDVLWELFDQACTQANAALGAAGITEGIALRDEENLRRYCTPDSDGALRYIAVMPLLREIGGEAIGAYIGTNTTRATMYLVPVQKRGRVAWQVAASGRPFDPGVVHDLFLSIFADDPTATSRLSPLSGGGYFQTPWG